MKKLSASLLVAFFVTGCASHESQVREAVRKDPSIIFDVIEENPERFIEIVNRAAQSAQQKSREKVIAKMRSDQENQLMTPLRPKLNLERRLSGDDRSKITVVEYADFQCGACGMVYQSLKKFKENHKGEIQFHFKNMPLDFHEMAFIAAAYFEALRVQDKARAFKFYETIFENQKALVNEAYLKKVVKQVGGDLKKAEKLAHSEAIRRQIEEDMAEFQSFGFTGTPVVIINGVALHGAQRVEEMERIADLTLKRSGR